MRTLSRTRRQVGWARVAVLACASVLSAHSAPAQAETLLAPGKTCKVLTDQRVIGIRRSYLVHVPAGYDGVTPLPVVLSLHGAFGTAQGFERESGLSKLADREGFLVIYPQGIGIFDLFRHWNSGHCCGRARKVDLDDVGFALGAVDEVAQRLPVDRGRIYVLGHSNGGMLAYRIAAEHSDAVAAVATVSATIGGNPSADEPEWVITQPAHPVPVLTLHGRNDEYVPYDGGRAAKGRVKNRLISVPRSVGFWVNANRCEPHLQGEWSYGGRIERQAWSGCDEEADVTLYIVDGWGHRWPGGRTTAKLPENDPLHNFEAAEIIWRFFERHRKTP